MNKQELISKLNEKFKKKQIPSIRVGYTVRVLTKFTEWDKERQQMFEGLVIKVHWKSWDLNSTMTVRKVSDGIGIEKVFPLHSVNVISIEVVKIARIKKAKLYYMRERFWKSARLQEMMTTKAQRENMMKDFGAKNVVKDEVVKTEELPQVEAEEISVKASEE